MLEYFLQHILSFSIWLPIAFGVAVLFTANDNKPCVTRWLALAGSIASFLVTIPLYTHFNFADGGFQFQERFLWIASFNINYHLGVDGISMPFIILNSFITLIVVLAGWQVIQFKVAQYNAAFLIMSGLFNGIFCALDGILFYVFFEASLIPLDAWQLTYFRGNAWTNPLSSAGNTDTSGNAASAPPGLTPQTNTTGQGALPDAIRLQIDLPASTGVRGRITLDWVRPNFSNTKT